MITATERDHVASQLLAMVEGENESRNVLASNASSLNEDLLMEAFGGGQSPAGIAINERTAIQCTAVLCAVRVISEAIGTLPFAPMQKLLPKGSEIASGHSTYPLFNTAPNEDMTPAMFLQAVLFHVLLNGNGYAAIGFDGAGQANELYPIRSNRVWTTRASDGSKVHFVQTGQGQYSIPDANMFHVYGLSDDGFTGLSVIQNARRSVGLTLAAEEFGSRHFANGAQPSGIITNAGKFDEDALNNIRKSWNRQHQGTQNAGKIGVMWEGMKYQQTSLSPEDSQFLETRKFQLGDIARLFKVPPHMIGDMSSSTNNNIEQQTLDFITNCLQWYVTIIEQEANRKLILPSERSSYYFRFDMDARFRGDMTSRFASYAVGRNNGFFCADDVRAKEGMNPLPDGQGATFMVPVNMMLASDFAKGKPVAEPATQPVNIPEDNTRSSLMPLVQDALERINRRECDRFRRAANKSGFADFVQRDLAESREYVTTCIRPICIVSGIDPVTAATKYIEHVKRAAEPFGERDASSIEVMLSQWPSNVQAAMQSVFANPNKL